ncbi:hypothetical protein D3C85_515750 [compost metagenome]
MVGAQAQAVFALRQSLAQHRHFGTHGVGDFHAHVAQATHAQDGDLLARTGFPVVQRRIQGDAGAQQRRRGVQRQVVGNRQHIAFLDDDAVRVAALRGRLAVRFDAVVGLDQAWHVLFQVHVARLAGGARVDEAAHAHVVAHLELADVGADGRDDAGDFMAGHHRESGAAPFVARLVDIGMAHATVFDRDGHVVFARGAALERERLQCGSRAQCGVAFGDGGHENSCI